MLLRRGVVWSCVILLACLSGFSTRATDDEAVGFLDNLFLEAGGGVKKPAGDQTTGFGSVGFNWGIPLTPSSDGIGLGVQVGGDFSLRRDDDEWNATAGLFGRNLKVGDEQLAGAVLADYQHTTLRNDLWSVRPILVMTVGAKDEVGLEGVIGINRQSSTRFDGIAVTTVRQETPDSAEAFYNHYWNEKLATELAAGYQFSGINEVLFRGQIVYGITPAIDMAVGGEVNGDGNYSCGGRVSFHFGGISRHDSLNNIYAWQKKDFYTPFPKRGAGSGGGGGLSSRPVFTSVITGGGSGI